MFLIYAGQSYYAEGGHLDYIGCAENSLDAIARAKSEDEDWWHVVDAETHRIVAKKDGRYCGITGLPLTSNIAKSNKNT